MSKYIDCGFIKGSAAIVESLWSEEDCLLGNKRRHGMSPVTNECILFLKKNKDLWSITDVNQDMRIERRITGMQGCKKRWQLMLNLGLKWMI